MRFFVLTRVQASNQQKVLPGVYRIFMTCFQWELEATHNVFIQHYPTSNTVLLPNPITGYNVTL